MSNYGTAFDRAQSAYDHAEPSDDYDFPTEECPWCGDTYRYNSDGEAYVHPVCDRKIADRTCATCNVVWVDYHPGENCEGCGNPIGGVWGLRVRSKGAKSEAPKMTDLAERFARAQGWTIGDFGHWCSPDGRYDLGLPTIDEHILPLIWADCKARGWDWARYPDFARVWTAWDTFGPDNYPEDYVAALCEAYCKAVECIDGDSE